MGIKLEPSDQKANRLTTRQIPRPIKKCHHTNIFPIDSQHPPQRLGIRQEAVYVDDNDFHQLTCLRLTKPQGKTKVMHKFQSSMFLLFQSSFSTQLLLSKNMVINHLRKKKYDFQLPVSRENRIVLARTDTVKNLSFVTPTCFKGKYFQLLVKYFGFEFTVRAIVCLNVANFLTLAHSRLLLFLYFRLFKTVDGKIKLSMVGFELQFHGLGGSYSTNCATTVLQRSCIGSSRKCSQGVCKQSVRMLFLFL